MSECPYSKTCHIYKRKNDPIISDYINEYCHGNLRDECIIKNNKNNGLFTSANLLPDGDILPHIDIKI